MKTQPRLALLSAGLLLLVASQAQAAGRFRAAPLAVTPVAYAAALGGCADDCCDPCVRICYRDRARCNVCCDPCTPDIKTCVTVCDPCTGCAIKIPVCIPGCCQGEPCVSGRCTVLGGELVRFTWCCGFSATVRITRRGDVLVTYR